jgi:hypothetical protein
MGYESYSDEELMQMANRILPDFPIIPMKSLCRWRVKSLLPAHPGLGKNLLALFHV